MQGMHYCIHPWWGSPWADTAPVPTAPAPSRRSLLNRSVQCGDLDSEPTMLYFLCWWGGAAVKLLYSVGLWTVKNHGSLQQWICLRPWNHKAAKSGYRHICFSEIINSPYKVERGFDLTSMLQVDNWSTREVTLHWGLSIGLRLGIQLQQWSHQSQEEQAFE